MGTAPEACMAGWPIAGDKTKIQISPNSGARGGLAWCDTRCDTASPALAPEFGELSIFVKRQKCKTAKKARNGPPRTISTNIIKITPKLENEGLKNRKLGNRCRSAARRGMGMGQPRVLLRRRLSQWRPFAAHFSLYFQFILAVSSLSKKSG